MESVSGVYQIDTPHQFSRNIFFKTFSTVFLSLRYVHHNRRLFSGNRTMMTQTTHLNHDGSVGGQKKVFSKLIKPFFFKNSFNGFFEFTDLTKNMGGYFRIVTP